MDIRRNGGYRSARRLTVIELAQFFASFDGTSVQERSQMKDIDLAPQSHDQKITIRNIYLSLDKKKLLDIMHENGGCLIQAKRKGGRDGAGDPVEIDGKKTLPLTVYHTQIKGLIKDGLAKSEQIDGIRKTTLNEAGMALAGVMAENDNFSKSLNRMPLDRGAHVLLAHLYQFGNSHPERCMMRDLPSGIWRVWGMVNLGFVERKPSKDGFPKFRLTALGDELCERFLIPYCVSFRDALEAAK